MVRCPPPSSCATGRPRSGRGSRWRFLATHIVVTVFPFPRTAFTLAAGLLFGPASGRDRVLASALSAVIALVLVRALGLQLSGLVSHPQVGRWMPGCAAAAGPRCCRCG